MAARPQNQRRHARLTFAESATEQVTTTHAVQVLDVSLGGARVEHDVVLRPGSTCHLRLPLAHNVITVVCHVAWSRAVARADASTHGAGLLFHTGLEFSAMA